MKKIILVRGISGSGKTTFAKSWVLEDPEHRVRFNNDDIRNMLGKYWVTSREPIVSKLKRSFLQESMLYQYDIIIDNLNLNPKEVAFYNDEIDSFNKLNKDLILEGVLEPYSLEFKDCFISVDECIRRDALRPNPIGEKVIKEQWRKYRSFILNIENNKLKKILESQDENLPHCIIVDLDATVALNIQGRPFYGDGCAEKINEDYPVKPIISIVQNYKYDVIYITGREDTPEIRKATTEWVGAHIGLDTHDRIIMRPLHDNSKGEVCKLNLYNKYIKDKYYVDFILEDSSKVVKMYRNLGLTVLQPNEGKY